MSLPESSGIACASALGSVTGTPTCSIGAATMKMISSTSMTSTIGVTLISASMPGPPPPLPPLGLDIAIGLPQEVALHDVEEVVAVGVHLRRQHLDLPREPIVSHDRRHRRDEADRGGAE